jgi:hypothetical protein
LTIRRRDTPAVRRNVLAAGPRSRTGAYVVVALAIAPSMGACGNGMRTVNSAHTLTKPASPRALAASVPVRLVIAVPRAGATTGATVTVRVVVTGTAAAPKQLRYVLDGKFTRVGGPRLTFHEVAPGTHELLVSLATNHHIHATRRFVVRAAAPAKPIAPAPERATEATHETPSTVETPVKTTPSHPKTPTHSVPAPPPPAPEGAIPQGNGGDGDSDNNGGPSDGDGNV